MLAKSRIVALKCGTVISRINRAERIHKSRVQISERDIHNSFPSLSLTNVRLFSTDKSKTTTGTATTSKKTTGIDKQRVDRSILEEVLMPEEEEPKTTAQKVKKGAENTFLYASVVVSVITLAGMTWFLFDYFFSGGSPTRIYSKALTRIRDDPQAQAALGDEIIGFGEQSRRSRRHIVSHAYKVRVGDVCAYGNSIQNQEEVLKVIEIL